MTANSHPDLVTSSPQLSHYRSDVEVHPVDQLPCACSFGHDTASISNCEKSRMIFILIWCFPKTSQHQRTMAHSNDSLVHRTPKASTPPPCIRPSLFELDVSLITTQTLAPRLLEPTIARLRRRWSCAISITGNTPALTTNCAISGIAV